MSSLGVRIAAQPACIVGVRRSVAYVDVGELVAEGVIETQRWVDVRLVAWRWSARKLKDVWYGDA
jgi:hypothetical protein